MRNAPFGFDLAPPDTAVSQANAVYTQGLRNDHVVHARLAEVTAFGQIAHTRKAA